LGWARPLQPLLARLMARRRAPFSRAAYAHQSVRNLRPRRKRWSRPWLHLVSRPGHTWP
jgi:hypothetical protein